MQPSHKQNPKEVKTQDPHTCGSHQDGAVKAEENMPMNKLRLVSTHLDIDDRDSGLGLVEVPSHPVHCLGHKVKHQIQIHLIFLQKGTKRTVV